RVDWLAAHLLYGEPFSENVAERVLAPLTFAVMNAQRVVTGESDAIRALLDGLLQSGIAMAIAGSSRPASGCEHHASHFWDLLAARGRRRPAPHGLQVGYATHFAMRLQRFGFDGGVRSVSPPLPRVPHDADVTSWLGVLSA